MQPNEEGQAESPIEGQTRNDTQVQGAPAGLTFREYMERHVASCKRTGNVTERMIALTFDNPQSNVTLTMTSMGMTTELSEIIDIIQKKVFYGIPMDIPSLLEELGDFTYYWDLLLDHLRQELCCDAINDITIRDLNRKKLLIRYPDGYSNKRALEKDKKAERAVFENPELY